MRNTSNTLNRTQLRTRSSTFLVLRTPAGFRRSCTLSTLRSMLPNPSCTTMTRVQATKLHTSKLLPHTRFQYRQRRLPHRMFLCSRRTCTAHPHPSPKRSGTKPVLSALHLLRGSPRAVRHASQERICARWNARVNFSIRKFRPLQPGKSR